MSMKCNHSRLRCTNNVFFCLVCGALVASPVTVEEIIVEKEKPADRYSVGFTRVWIPLRETESVGIRTLLRSHFFIVKC